MFEESASSILSRNESPDVGFRYSVNPYRGCFHGCAYCYARPTHQYLDFGAGTDFERKLVVKVNAPELLRAAFARRSWRGELVAFSGNTDCYQPLEASYELTRRLLEVCLEFRNPVGIITKSVLVRRDAALLAELAARTGATVTLSIPFADEAMARAIEPYAPAPVDRFAALEALADAGVPVSVAVAPLIPGLNDAQVHTILARAKECGARSASHILLRLPAEVRGIFLARLREAYPDRCGKVTAALREARGGALYRSGFGDRMRGRGERWRATTELFALARRRLGLDGGGEGAGPSAFRRPERQLGLFDPAP